MKMDPIIRSRTFAKTMLLFFAVLFIAVLIHPDVNLLAVHDVKITKARSQFAFFEGKLMQQAPFLFVGPQIDRSAILERRVSEDKAVSSHDLGASGILRI
ncbi:MAG: hypothetical protein WA628_00150 [Terriglobales bacterium]